MGDVVAALAEAGHAADVVRRPPSSGHWCTAVVVSYAGAGQVASLRRLADRVWLDAIDSWILLDGSGLRAGHPAYAARGLRDASRLLRMGQVDLATWISRADLRSDRRTVRARRRLVLPGRVDAPAVRPAGERRAVLVGDWAYPPNRDGLRWVVDRVLPHTPAPLHVYGAGVPPLPARVRVHGYVEDPAELYSAGDVHLGALRFGAGVKRKVLQPLLAGLPVVSTRAGAHGLLAHPLLTVEDDPVCFAAALDRRLAAPPEVAPAVPSALLDGDDREQVLTWLRGCEGATRRTR